MEQAINNKWNNLLLIHYPKRLNNLENCNSEKLIEILQEWVHLIDRFIPSHLFSSIIDDPIWNQYLVVPSLETFDFHWKLFEQNTKLCIIAYTLLETSYVFLPCPTRSIWSMFKKKM
jgi:hypothetical protein